METDNIKTQTNPNSDNKNKKTEEKTNQGDPMENNTQEIKLTIVDNLLEQSNLPNQKLLNQYHRLEKEIKNIKKKLETKIANLQRVQNQISDLNKNKNQRGEF
ncbi:hypothetical protein BKH41_04075 [Helicobacter sp. 12S02232-10]|uniref:hypothetical protein n=1 Tax=Helicobacter sp. 12S02232-10 TaxID=1476197 RepID=UPI000BA4F37C|nr:hypothetical protein [Helicobacter sp. 12S02232-10]PAF48813.1 hypothetical protein BKH41_04075 [Helicobacter sp. 12S02232-10]